MQELPDDEQLRLTRRHLARIIAGVANCASMAQGEVAELPPDSPRVCGFAPPAPDRRWTRRGASRGEDEPRNPDGPEPEPAFARGPRPHAPPGGALARVVTDDPCPGWCSAKGSA